MNGTRPDWLPDWDGQCAAIVASGPSLNRDEVESLKDRIHVVAINASYELCPWADMLYACDTKWWQLKRGAPDFKGLKVTQDGDAVGRFPDLRKITIRMQGVNKQDLVHEFLLDNWCEVGGGGNSCFQALNLLGQIGVKAVALLGVDFRDFDGKLHWHGRHPDSGGIVLNNPAPHNFRNWIGWMNAAAPKMRSIGMDVMNCSMQSALTCFPKMPLPQVLERWGL